MKSNERTLAPTAPVQRQAAAHAGASGASDTPRQLAQGAQIAQLNRKKKGHFLGNSHSKTGVNGKVTSHKPGKAREENPNISRSKNNRRRRMLETNVNNSIKKSEGQK
ncbi:MAG TPA: hypothetical protein VK195_18085 [Burkholderiaceae bacterium]|nr:hypothetical protein [Burkholderiaceae bacterium]